MLFDTACHHFAKNMCISIAVVGGSVLFKNSSYLSFPPALLWVGLTGWGNVLRRQVQMAQAHGFPMYNIPDIFIKHPRNLTAVKEEAMSSSKLEGLVVENQFQEFFIKRICKTDLLTL